jgi:ATP-binding cassette subfamily B protein
MQRVSDRGPRSSAQPRTYGIRNVQQQKETRVKIPLRAYWALLVRYLRPQWRAALLLAVLVVAGIGLQLANPQLMRGFIDAASAGATTMALLRIALAFLGVALAQQFVSVGATYIGERVGWMATNGLRADLAEHCLRLDMGWHSAHNPGEMIERIDGDVTALSSFFSQLVIQVAGNGLLVAGVFALLLFEDWRLGLPLGAFCLAALYTLLRLRNIAVPHWAAERQAGAELFGYVEERLAGTEDIRANGTQAHVMRGFYRLMRRQMACSLRAGLMANLMLNSLFLLMGLGTALAFALGAHLFQAGAVTIGTVYLVFRYTTMLEHPLQQITRQLQELQRAGAAIGRIQALLATESRIADPDVAAGPLPPGPLAVAFHNVSFAYHDGLPDDDEGAEAPAETVLENISFALQPGTVLGLLGRTGSGKTTLSRLLFRLYDPDQGCVALGAAGALVDIRQLSVLKLRQRIGMVTQNVHLFHGTVRDNLTFFDRQIPEAHILAALRSLGLEEWVRSLPAGLDTELESGGSGLSAGEAQLLAFARVFLQDPGLVILDEASSRLDPATERLLDRAVGALLRGRTAIIIAHRLCTVDRADEIMILEGGRIREHGPRAALAADASSHFYHLLQTGLEEVLA